MKPRHQFTRALSPKQLGSLDRIAQERLTMMEVDSVRVYCCTVTSDANRQHVASDSNPSRIEIEGKLHRRHWAWECGRVRLGKLLKSVAKRAFLPETVSGKAAGDS